MSLSMAITPADWASVQVGHLWLVREGEVLVSTQRMTPTSNLPGTYDAPPDEFVEACAPCETCENTRTVVADDGRGGLCDPPCPDCRIELVEECDTCDGQGGYMYGGSWGFCVPCNASGITHLGWGYAIGQPLPICHLTQPRTTPNLVATPNGVTHNPAHAPHNAPDLTTALAHYGDPESLVGKWALQVQVTP